MYCDGRPLISLQNLAYLHDFTCFHLLEMPFQVASGGVAAPSKRTA